MKLKIINLQPTINKLNRLPEMTDEEIEAGLNDMIDQIVPAVWAYTPIDKGTLRSAIGGTIEKESDLTRAIIQADEAKVEPVVVASVAGGTRPHWPPWGPGSKLASWAERHGIPPFLVARAIAQHGTIKRFGRPKGGAEMFDKGLDDSMGFITSRAQQMGGNIVRIF